VIRLIDNVINVVVVPGVPVVTVIHTTVNVKAVSQMFSICYRVFIPIFAGNGRMKFRLFYAYMHINVVIK
jgi:hypothetical protein